MKSNYQVTISTGTFLKAVLVFLVLGFLWYIHEIVAMFLISVLLAALIEPFAEWFAVRNIPRALAVLIVYVVLLTFVVLVFVGLTPVIAEQFSQLSANTELFTEQITAGVTRIQAFSMQHGLIAQNITESLQGAEQGISQSLGSVFSTVKGVFGGLVTAVIILVLTFYMVAEGDKVLRYVKHLAPAEYQPFITDVLRKMQKKIGAWLRGQMLLGLIIGAATFIGLSLLGVENALLLAVIAGFCEFIPYVGPMLSAVPAVIIAFSQAPMLALVVIGLYLLIQQTENHLLVPKIMEKVTGLNPIVSILALLIGVKMGGVFGAFFAIPLAMMLMVVMEDIFHPSSDV